MPLSYDEFKIIFMFGFVRFYKQKAPARYTRTEAMIPDRCLTCIQTCVLYHDIDNSALNDDYFLWCLSFKIFLDILIGKHNRFNFSCLQR